MTGHAEEHVGTHAGQGRPGQPERPLRLLVVTPVYNDWDSFLCLLTDIDQAVADQPVEVSIAAVNDASTAPVPRSLGAIVRSFRLKSVEVLDVAYNMGHQRAIAFGLAEAVARGSFDAVLIMDTDGEDRPGDIPSLLRSHRQQPESIIVARRIKRSEGRLFRVFYALYKLLFRILTGREIVFGNFSLVPMGLLRRLVNMPEVLNNIAAAFLRSRMPIVAVPTQRGKRYAGRSKMNFTSLILHGMSAMSVFADILFTRLLIATMTVAVATVFGVAVVIAIKLFTDLAIPGWATTVIGLLSVIFFQAVTLMISSAFLLLNARANMPIGPLAQRERFITGRVLLFSTCAEHGQA